MESIQYEIQDRIKEVMAVFYKGNGSEFCRDNDLSQGSMANVVAGRRSNPSFETVKKILSNEENRISADWLILGIGEMQRGSVVSEDVNELRKKLLAKMEELDNIRTELF